MDLHHLYVQKDLRGQGIGRALVRAAEAVADALGARSLSVSSMPENDMAGQVYLAMGFRESGSQMRRFRRDF
jgi:diamine N-acetyltransferase